MVTFDHIISTVIAIVYNVFIHTIISTSIQEIPFQDKLDRSAMYLLLAGGIAIIVSNKLKNSKNASSKEIILGNGLWYGGLLLLISPLLTMWSGGTSDLKIFMLIGILGTIVWRSTKDSNSEELYID